MEYSSELLSPWARKEVSIIGSEIWETSHCTRELACELGDVGLKFCAPSYPVRSGNFVLMPDDGTLVLKTGAGAAETRILLTYDSRCWEQSQGWEQASLLLICDTKLCLAREKIAQIEVWNGSGTNVLPDKILSLCPFIFHNYLPSSRSSWYPAEGFSCPSTCFVILRQQKLLLSAHLFQHDGQYFFNYLLHLCFTETFCL